MSMINKGMMSSNTDQWATPQAFFDELNKEFMFTLDVCADDSNAKCVKFFTKDPSPWDKTLLYHNGLDKSWYGEICWMNPPYGKEIGRWVGKAASCGALVVGLLPARTDTKWFHAHIYGKAEIRFIKGRLKFGDAKNSAPFS